LEGSSRKNMDLILANIQSHALLLCFGVCQDGPNPTIFGNVTRWSNCNNVLECAKTGQKQQRLGVCQDGPYVTMFWSVPRRAKCKNVFKECGEN
jgi:hypothetical protein